MLSYTAETRALRRLQREAVARLARQHDQRRWRRGESLVVVRPTDKRNPATHTVDIGTPSRVTDWTDASDACRGLSDVGVPSGGAERIALLMATLLVKRGLTVDFIVGDMTPDDPDGASGIRFHVMGVKQVHPGQHNEGPAVSIIQFSGS